MNWINCKSVIKIVHDLTTTKSPKASTESIFLGMYSMWQYFTPRYHYGYGFSQCEATLHCNVGSHWAVPYPEWSLYTCILIGTVYYASDKSLLSSIFLHCKFIFMLLCMLFFIILFRLLPHDFLLKYISIIVFTYLYFVYITALLIHCIYNVIQRCKNDLFENNTNTINTDAYISNIQIVVYLILCCLNHNCYVIGDKAILRRFPLAYPDLIGNMHSTKFILKKHCWNHQHCCWFLYVDTWKLWWDKPQYRAPKKRMSTETRFDDVGGIEIISAQVSNKSRTTPAWQLDHVNPAHSLKRHIMKIIIIIIIKIILIITIKMKTIMIKRQL